MCKQCCTIMKKVFKYIFKFNFQIVSSNFNFKLSLGSFDKCFILFDRHFLLNSFNKCVLREGNLTLVTVLEEF